MTKRLYRSRKDKMLGGVAGGIAEYFDVDPVLIRLLFVLLVFLHGIGLIGYIVLWIVVPQRRLDAAAAMAGTGGATAASEPGSPEMMSDAEFRDLDDSAATGASTGYGPSGAGRTAGAPPVDPAERERLSAKRQRTGGIVLIVLGAFFLLNNLLPHFSFSDYWPLFFIAGGAWMLWRGVDTTR